MQIHSEAVGTLQPVTPASFGVGSALSPTDCSDVDGDGGGGGGGGEDDEADCLSPTAEDMRPQAVSLPPSSAGSGSGGAGGSVRDPSLLLSPAKRVVAFSTSSAVAAASVVGGSPVRVPAPAAPASDSPLFASDASESVATIAAVTRASRGKSGGSAAAAATAATAAGDHKYPAILDRDTLVRQMARDPFIAEVRSFGCFSLAMCFLALSLSRSCLNACFACVW